MAKSSGSHPGFISAVLTSCLLSLPTVLKQKYWRPVRNSNPRSHAWQAFAFSHSANGPYLVHPGRFERPSRHFQCRAIPTQLQVRIGTEGGIRTLKPLRHWFLKPACIHSTTSACLLKGIGGSGRTCTYKPKGALGYSQMGSYTVQQIHSWLMGIC